MEEEIFIPIPDFPKFNLRSSLIDKDPVIWVHMLASYIKLLGILIDYEHKERRYTIKTQQQLETFLKTYLSETYEEGTKIFSLGAVNPDIKKNSSSLRVLVFQLVKEYSIVKLNLTGDAIWNYVCIYVRNNGSTVRSVIEGSHKSYFNDNKKSGKISSIGLIHKHLINLIEAGKFNDNDLINLSSLIGQYTKSKKNGNDFTIRSIHKRNPGIMSFAEKFVTKIWIQQLETTYADGCSIHSRIVERIMIVSLISLSPSKLATLATELGITDSLKLKLSPLFSAVLISEPLQDIIPGITDRLVFLKTISFAEGPTTEESISISAEHINLLLELFPQLTRGKAKSLLLKFGDDVEEASNRVFQDPAILDDLTEDEHSEPSITGNLVVDVSKRKNVYDGDGIDNLDFSGHTVIHGKKGLNHMELANPDAELKKRTLQNALRLIYESDEDEPDDAYEESEPSEGQSESQGKGTRNSNQKLLIHGSSEKVAVASDQETLLFKLLKEEGSALFERSLRKTPERQELKKATKWSDEQIEGWYRVIMKSPKRYRLLEDQYFYNFRR